jgi:hypothetical protein
VTEAEVAAATPPLDQPGPVDDGAPLTAVGDDDLRATPNRQPRRPAQTRPKARPAASDGTGIVDLRERVKAGLLRLRTRATQPVDPSAPDQVAAGG